MATLDHTGRHQYRDCDQHHHGNRPGDSALRPRVQLGRCGAGGSADLDIRRNRTQERVSAAGGHHHSPSHIPAASLLADLLSHPAAFQLPGPPAVPVAGRQAGVSERIYAAAGNHDHDEHVARGGRDRRPRAIDDSTTIRFR